MATINTQTTDEKVLGQPALIPALSSLKGTGLVKLGLTLIVDLFSVVLRCFWATPVAASGSGIGPRGPTA
jgi:hypothetical protein